MSLFWMCVTERLKELYLSLFLGGNIWKRHIRNDDNVMTLWDGVFQFFWVCILCFWTEVESLLIFYHSTVGSQDHAETFGGQLGGNVESHVETTSGRCWTRKTRRFLPVSTSMPRWPMSRLKKGGRFERWGRFGVNLQRWCAILGPRCATWRHFDAPI